MPFCSAVKAKTMHKFRPHKTFFFFLVYPIPGNKIVLFQGTLAEGERLSTVDHHV